LAGTKFPVGGVNACGVNVDEHLAGRRRGIGQVAVFENIRTAKLFKICSFHLVSCLPLCSKFMRRIIPQPVHTTLRQSRPLPQKASSAGPARLVAKARSARLPLRRRQQKDDRMISGRYY
jgi:hypothetical protein